MNLHGIVRNAIGAINPEITCWLARSIGYVTAEDGSQGPIYIPATPLPCQVQNLTFTDLQKLDGLNIEGDRRAIYLNGQWDGVVRADQKGGDLVMFPDRTIWLVAQVLENWPDWSKLAITRQLNVSQAATQSFILGQAG